MCLIRKKLIIFARVETPNNGGICRHIEDERQALGYLILKNLENFLIYADNKQWRSR